MHRNHADKFITESEEVMPSIEYSKSKGLVQKSSSTGGFSISDVPLRENLEAITGIADNTTTLKGYGTSQVATDTNGTRTVKVASLTSSDVGALKTVVKTTADNEIIVHFDANGDGTINNALPAGDNLNNVGDYVHAIWLGDRWALVSEVTT